ncbi:ABC-2 type transport system permease protein [Anoxybacillus tepidamans]|uniref:ABC-2 type transport system permease protein n=2 Tax=Anoxybacteroides tepidamans TaxID=265948 RepID=A0A7W8IRE5_9BACL|nr:ABC-2 type transport system permease protein [Anoxybacillus tepidamans]
MMDSRLLWKQRLIRYGSEIKRYLRYMLNDHLLFVLLIGLGAGAVMYQRWVATLPPHFPYAIVGAVIFSLFLAYSPVRTFLEEADIVFLLPAEKQLVPYIQRSFWFSLIVQAYILLLVLLAMAPLHLKLSTLSLSLFGLFLLFMKGWNLFISWKETYFTEPKARWFGSAVRIFFNGVCVYFVLTNVSLIFLLSLLLIMAVLSVYFVQAAKQKGLPWERLIQQEERAKMRFYRLANIFTDVPHLKAKAKRRKWLDGLLSLISYRQEHAFRYLYARTFLRAGDYFGLYVRLTAIACFFLYIIPAGYGKIITSLFFLYATGFQLFALSRHHRGHIFVKLYPLSHARQKEAVLRLLFQLLLMQNAFFSLFLVVIGYFSFSLLSLIAGAMFSYWLLFMYLNNRWRR